jgi:biotin transport system substrate-specific component
MSNQQKTGVKITAQECAVIGIFTALTCIMAQISVPLPPPLVPVSFGLVGVYITGILLAPKHAVLTQIVYLLLGAFGLPVFSNFRGGMGALFGPTGGYLFVYPLMAAIVSTAMNSRMALESESRRAAFLRAALSMLVAHTLLYSGGTAWLSYTTGRTFAEALVIAVYPFIVLDAFKIAFCVTAIVPLRARLRSMRLLRLDGNSTKVTL